MGEGGLTGAESGQGLELAAGQLGFLAAHFPVRTQWVLSHTNRLCGADSEQPTQGSDGPTASLLQGH
jgi:hypothetical protein